MVTKFYHNMETECSLTCSQQPATEQRASVASFTPSRWYIAFNSIRYLCHCPGLNVLRISHVKHFMIHNLHISYDFISSPVFFPHQLQLQLHYITLLMLIGIMSIRKVWLYVVRFH